MRKEASLPRSILTAFSLSLALTVASSADLVYVGDDAGNVGRYDTVSGTTSFVGSIASFNPSQALGLAYDSASNSVLVLDRNTNRVFAMNATTGVSSLLFTASGTFQGGAMSGGVLYGTQEGLTGTPVAGFNLTGTQVVTGSMTPDHTHAMGVDAATGQLYLIGAFDYVIRRVNTDGTIGSAVVTASGNLEGVDDLDYLGGNFLITQYAARNISLVNGTTGATSVYLTTSQIDAMGLTGSITGVAVGYTAVPEPASLAMMGLGLAGLAGFAVRRSRSRG